MVEVIVPRGGNCPHREAAWAWCREQYEWPVVEAPGGDPWIKAQAIWPVLQASTADIIVLADGDVYCEGLPQAIQAVADGAAWSLPHLKVHRLSQEGTAALVNGQNWRAYEPDQPPYEGLVGGGMLVASREVFLSVPMDPRFVGFGQEDMSHGIALHTLLGRPWRGTSTLLHLWHPPQQRLTRKWGSIKSKDLCRRYLDARHDSNAIRLLLNEAHDALDTHQQALHADSALAIW